MTIAAARGDTGAASAVGDYRAAFAEAVRVGAVHRSGGLGTAMLRWSKGPAATATGSTLVQLTSDAQRVDAHRFYERLGFVGSHRGFKHHVR